jgi:hypothetical protein
VFQQNKHVEVFLARDALSELGLSREHFVAMAYVFCYTFLLLFLFVDVSLSLFRLSIAP